MTRRRPQRKGQGFESPRPLHRPYLTSPLPIPPHHGGDDDDEECPGPTHHHHHSAHHSVRSLADHLRFCFHHDWPDQLLQTYGVDLVRQVLDELTATYGDLLDAPLAAPPDSRPGYYDRPLPPPAIKRPAGFITWHVKQRAQVQAKDKTSHGRPSHLRAVGANEPKIAGDQF